MKGFPSSRTDQGNCDKCDVINLFMFAVTLQSYTHVEYGAMPQEFRTVQQNLYLLKLKTVPSSKLPMH